jgi:ribosomal protein S18 acetylase RimI-like enzyme
MKSEMEIRQFTAADADTLASPLANLVSQLRGSGTQLDTAALRTLLSDAGVYVFGAYLNGSLAGTLTLTKSHLLSGVRSRIEDVVVDEAYRRQGVAAALVRHALEVSKDMGAVTVDLTSAPSRTAANALYRQMGFALRETNVYRYSLQDSH